MGAAITFFLIKNLIQLIFLRLIKKMCKSTYMSNTNNKLSLFEAVLSLELSWGCDSFLLPTHKMISENLDLSKTSIVLANGPKDPEPKSGKKYLLKRSN